MRKYLEANIEHNTLNMPKETWLKLRKKGIGGSDASSILNLNPYRSSVNVYMEKIDENIEINKEILTYIVKKSNLSIRAMMGLVNTIKAHKDLIRNSIPEEKIKMLIDDMLYK